MFINLIKDSKDKVDNQWCPLQKILTCYLKHTIIKYRYTSLEM